MIGEAMSIDSESLLFAKLGEYRDDIPNLISRRQLADRRKLTSTLCEAIRKRMAQEIDGAEKFFCIDFKPIEVCRLARSKHCKIGRNEYRTAPDTAIVLRRACTTTVTSCTPSAG